LGHIPPGLYRDEAYNGLDALKVIAGDRQDLSPFYFEGNNGREPAYIYLTVLSTFLFGQSVFAIRFAAAVIGTLTTWFTYKLAKTWFGQNVGLLSAWVWAITVWPIHLSRIGLRPVLLPLMLAITFWLGTIAYRRSRDGRSDRWLWLLAGITYGGAFYTYLAARFTIFIFILLVVYLLATRRREGLWPGVGWAVSGMAICLIPLALVTWQEPELVMGRLGQVSVLSPAINQGDLPGTLWRQLWSTLGLFLIKGDTIIRHNPPGRPVFDLLMAIPFLVGLFWCLRRWQSAAAVALLLWVGIMLGPTLLAEDSPHFLRAAGVLPGAMMLPALGLSQLWDWSKLPPRLGQVMAIGLLFLSMIVTIKDYFIDFGQQPMTAYWFESAARDLAESVNELSGESQVYLDQRFWDSWPSIRYLMQPEQPVMFFRPEQLSVDEFGHMSTIFAWPYQDLDLVSGAISAPSTVAGFPGSLAQGDLEAAPYPLYVRYEVDVTGNRAILANFDNNIQLREAELTELSPMKLQIDLYWSADTGSEEPVVAFIHVVDQQDGSGSLIGQSDSIPSQGYWPRERWRPGLIIHDRHVIELETEFDKNEQQIRVGLYEANTLDNYALLGEDGLSNEDTWLLRP